MVMKSLRTAAALVILAGLAACGQEGSDEVHREVTATTAQEAPVATWRVVEPPAPESTQVPLLVNEVSCASGQSAEGRIQKPEVAYQPEAVIITVRVEYAGGAQECPSNPDTPLTVELSEPVGARELVDGGQPRQ
ncbi:hypothetical protein [Kineococcus sp. SYSU DK018]|uniref:hypothetical protein n=1 Tax=Kineococcus sp. SYSU DK018 TaxID=3383139 RepID=UPI003D7DA222